MVPVVSKMLAGGQAITQVMAKDKLDSIIQRTRERGAEIVGLLGSGSAYYSPSAAAFRMVESILKDSGEIFVVSACLNGEYGLTDLSIGVPCQIGGSGIKKIIELDLSGSEKKAFNKSAQAIKTNIESL
jgi:malate dehydrogenase